MKSLDRLQLNKMWRMHIGVIIFTVLVTMVISLFTVGCKSQGSSGVENANLLVITLDTVRADHIGAYGNSDVQTPNIDNLAKNGIRFESCYTPVPITFPAHCAMFTGKYPLTLNVRNNGKYRLGENENTLAEFFKQKGYHNYAVIAAYVLSSKFGLNQGFDLYDDSLDDTKIVNNFTSEIFAEQVYEKFKSWFNIHKEQPFFAWVHFYDPHLPYIPPKKFLPEGKETLVDHYNAEISYVDHYVGKIIDDLKESKKLDRTVIVIVGDHGEGFGEHNEYGHSIFCYQEFLKVPLIFYNTHRFKSKVVKQPVNLVDLMPTFLDLYGQAIPQDVDGMSLASLLSDGSKPKDNLNNRFFYFESVTGQEEFNWAPLTGIISDSFKYISLPEQELYQLDMDPQEKDNLFWKKKKVVDRMKKQLDKFVANNAGKSKNTKRELTQKDIAHLKSLGYISAAPKKSKANSMMDPKKGILLDLELGKLSRRIDNGEYVEAEAELLRILKESPQSKTQMIYSLLIKIYEKAENPLKMMETLKEATREFPEFINFRISLALTLMKEKAYEDVIKQAEIILTLDPRHTHAYVLRADANQELGRSAETLKDYKKASQLEPGNIMLNMKYAELLAKSNRNYEAAKIYEGLIDKKGVADNEKFLMWYANFNMQIGKKMRAMEMMKRLVKLNPDGNHYFFYAMALAENRKFPEAIKAMETALKLYSDQLTDKQKEQARYALELWEKSSQ